MAGTRLVIHSTFFVELIVLVASAFLYASYREHDPSLSADPFLADKSGWKIIVEDVSPAPSPDDDGGVGVIIANAGEYAAAMMSQLYSTVMGVDVTEKKFIPDRTRRTSAFVQELRRKIDRFTVIDDRIIPPLRINLSLPQVESSSPVLKSLADALERGFQSQSTHQQQQSLPVVSIGSTAGSRFDVSAKELCDNYQPPEPIQSKPNNRELRFPEIIVLMGCSSTTIPDSRLSSVEVNQSNGIVVVRTVYTVEQENELKRHLEKEVPSILSRAIFVPLSANNEYRVGSVSIELIDENPTSHDSEKFDGLDEFTAKVHFDLMGKALSSSTQSTMGSLLDDLSFVYGGQIAVNDDASSLSEGSVIHTKDAISLAVHSSAYLPLLHDIVEPESADDETDSIEKYVSSEDLADWITHAHSRKRVPGDVEWVFFVPSEGNTPLTVHDESTGGDGGSIILSSPTKLEEGGTNAYPNGMSIVNVPSFGSTNVDLDKIQESYEDKILEALVHLVGYIRAIHGLPPSNNQMLIDLSSTTSSVRYHGVGGEKLSYWELESIARNHYSSSLELALHEIDTLMAVLYQHSGALAFPVDVAFKLNNATHLLRESISLAETGFPAIYATSLLHGSLHYLESVKGDHRLVELPYFGLDHYLAVFSPLVLPLMLPMIMGLIREVKRYRELVQKKKDK